jgi:hypothetical protein
MAVGESRGVAVQCRLPISHGTFGEVTKVEVAWLLWFILLFRVPWVHYAVTRDIAEDGVGFDLC